MFASPERAADARVEGRRPELRRACAVRREGRALHAEVVHTDSARSTERRVATEPQRVGHLEQAELLPRRCRSCRGTKVATERGAADRNPDEHVGAKGIGEPQHRAERRSEPRETVERADAGLEADAPWPGAIGNGPLASRLHEV